MDSPVKIVLLDIEGTICPIAFVKEVLFPHALAALPTIAREQWDDPTFAALRDAFPPKARGSVEALVECVEDMTRRDVKDVALKALQGHVLPAPYAARSLASPLFPDVLPALRALSAPPLSVRLAIYSSGSRAAQSVFFSRVVDMPPTPAPASAPGGGDVPFARWFDAWWAARKADEAQGKAPPPTDANALFEATFDVPAAGPKLEAASYARVCAAMGVAPGEEAAVLFLTDSIWEAQAAEEAGLRVGLLARPGNAELPAWAESRFVVLAGLGELVDDGGKGRELVYGKGA